MWTTGVGTAVAASAATLAFGGPALADALTGPSDLAPAAPSVSQSTRSDAPTPSASSSLDSPTPSASTSSPAIPGAGTIDSPGARLAAPTMIRTTGRGHDVSDDNGGDRDDSVSDDGPETRRRRRQRRRRLRRLGRRLGLWLGRRPSRLCGEAPKNSAARGRSSPHRVAHGRSTS